MVHDGAVLIPHSHAAGQDTLYDVIVEATVVQLGDVTCPDEIFTWMPRNLKLLTLSASALCQTVDEAVSSPSSCPHIIFLVLSVLRVMLWLSPLCCFVTPSYQIDEWWYRDGVDLV